MELEKPVATGKLQVNHCGAGRQKTKAKIIDENKKKGFPEKMFFLFN